jgi:hypothetical protein
MVQLFDLMRDTNNIVVNIMQESLQNISFDINELHYEEYL